MGIGLSRLQKLATSAAKKAKAAGRASKKKPDLTSKEYKAQQVAKRNAARKAERAAALKVKKGKEIAKKKAIQKNVAAKKARDAAGMAKAKALATKGMTAAAKKKPAKAKPKIKTSAQAKEYRKSKAYKEKELARKRKAKAVKKAPTDLRSSKPRQGDITIHEGLYKERIMREEGLNTWPSTRDPFPKNKKEWSIYKSLLK